MRESRDGWRLCPAWEAPPRRAVASPFGRGRAERDGPIFFDPPAFNPGYAGRVLVQGQRGDLA